MDILSYVTEAKLILIPALYVIGFIIKKSMLIKDKYIPLILLLIAIILSVSMGGALVVDNIIQGILVAGATVMTDQIIKQTKKEE